jgi:RimJ/RimL family protein N-acetyltransferase
MTPWLRAAPPDEIDAGPVRLRRWQPADAEEITRLVGENVDHLRPWMPWAQQAPSLAEEREILERFALAWDARTDFGYAVRLPDGASIGGIGLHTRQGPGILEIGYWIAAAHANRGYTTAAAGALARTAITLPGVERVEIRCDEANLASAAVPRKLGFQLVEVYARPPSAPGELGRGMIWAVRRGEWPA